MDARGLRVLLLALLALAPLAGAGPAAASPPTPEWEFERGAVEGTGLVGEPVRVEVRIRANLAVDARIVLLAPDWVRVEGDPWDARIPAGRTASHAWTVTPTREGFWAVVATSAPDSFGAACGCAFGHASTNATLARVAPTPEEAIPTPEVERETRLAVQGSPDAAGAHAVTVTHAVRPVSPWLAHATLGATVTQSSTWLCDGCALAASGPGNGVDGAPGEPAVVAVRMDLRPEDAYTVWDHVRVRFDVHPDATLHPEVLVTTGCRNHRYSTDESWDCHTPSREWRHVMSIPERIRYEIPFFSGVLTVGALAVAALSRRALR